MKSFLKGIMTGEGPNNRNTGKITNEKDVDDDFIDDLKKSIEANWYLLIDEGALTPHLQKGWSASVMLSDDSGADGVDGSIELNFSGRKVAKIRRKDMDDLLDPFAGLIEISIADEAKHESRNILLMISDIQNAVRARADEIKRIIGLLSAKDKEKRFAENKISLTFDRGSVPREMGFKRSENDRPEPVLTGSDIQGDPANAAEWAKAYGAFTSYEDASKAFGFETLDKMIRSDIHIVGVSIHADGSLSGSFEGSEFSYSAEEMRSRVHDADRIEREIDHEMSP